MTGAWRNSGKRPEDAINSELRVILDAQNLPCPLGQAPIWIGQPCDHAPRNAKMALADEYALIVATTKGWFAITWRGAMIGGGHIARSHAGR